MKNQAKWVIKFFFVRLFWFTASALTLPIFGKIVIRLYETFRASSISFTLDTLYLNWNTTFPAVTVCEILNSEKVWDVSEEYFGSKRDYRIDEIVADIVYFHGKCSSCVVCDEIDCPQDFYKLTEVFRKQCDKLIKNCLWLGKSFECCDEFQVLRTEFGICYSFNSMQTDTLTDTEFINNRQTGSGSLKFFTTEDIQFFVHPRNEIPYLFSADIIKETVLLGSPKEIIFDIVEISNDPSVEIFSPQHRNCRFIYELPQTSESDYHLYNFYGYSICIVECVKSSHLLICNCINHFLLKQNESYYPVCDIDGLECLSENYDKIMHHRKNNCQCLSSCEEPEYNVIYSSVDSSQTANISSISVSMINLPAQRYVRNVVKTNLDLIISVGGIGGLFFGASMLSVLELISKILNICKVFFLKIKKLKSGIS